MNIAVVAANGRTGRAFVRAALLAGHTVRAGVHGKNTLSDHKNLVIIRCDATDPNDLIQLLQGADAAASFIGHTKTSTRYVQSDAIRHLIKAGEKNNVVRIVSLTGTGVRQSGDHITLLDRILNAAIMLIDPARVRDGIQHAKILKESKCEWTILRVLKLQNTPPKSFRLTSHGPTKLFVGRQDVAQAALHVIENRTYIREMPILS